MPEGFKIQGKCAAPGVVYVSTKLNPEVGAHAAWFKLFVARLILDTKLVAERFGTVVVPNGGLPGDLLATVSGFRTGLPAENVIVAAVGVLTTPYMNASVDGSGEFAQLVAAVGGSKDALPGTDPEVPLQVFLAPLDNVWWDRYKVNGVPLDDKRFTRLREQRFTYPTDKDIAAATQEIEEASLKVVTETPGKE